MIRNYLMIALRNLTRNKAFSFIHITGLGIGLACCMLIFLYAKDEWTFDRFQAKADQLYRITCSIVEKDGKESRIGASAMVQGPAFKAAIPAVQDFVRVQESDHLIRIGAETYSEHVAWADANFFSVFSFPLKSGNAASVLGDQHSVVLAEDEAIKYFGTADPIGKIIELEFNDTFQPFTVSGIARRSPQNSTIRFGFVLPFSYREAKEPESTWDWLSYPTYLVLAPGTDPAAVTRQMNNHYQQVNSKQIAEMKSLGQGSFTWGLQAFPAMHLDPDMYATSHVSDPAYSYILSGIAIFILIIACINFINLTIAQSIRRSKEIGIRKVVGGQRKQLVFQFLGESVLLCAFAFVLALVIAVLALPTFNQLANKQLSLTYLADPLVIAGYILLFLVTAFVAGFYPALVLSGFDPVKTLYNRVSAGAGRNLLSRSLVVVQFSLSTFLIIATLFVYAQFDFLTHKPLGYNDHNLLQVTAHKDGDKQLMKLLKQEFSKLPGVLSVAPRMNGIWVTRSKANEKDVEVLIEHIDESYLATMEVPLVAGRNFSPDFPADSTRAVLVNESYVAAAGWKDPVGKKLRLNQDKDQLEVVGVVKDYHFASLKEKIMPQIFSQGPSMPFGQFMIRISPDDKARTLAGIGKVYNSLVPFRPFEYDYKQDLNFRDYESEQRWKSIISFAAVITIFISCIGLFGLATTSIRRRIKEIGVRKVLGASEFQISRLVSGNFLVLVLIAFLISVPLAWYAASSWLQGFAYQVQGYWWIFPVACAATVAVALLTVGSQAFSASRANPVKSLRTE
ncbi:MAG: FtsX-like permease family protein [Chitinophagaceae bacterium]|nr:MAG: FtsX-like permease family protein [Chitinophagaceae bacterium]